MAKNAKGTEKLKILYLRDFLLSSSDAKHPVTMNDIMDELESHNITADRKSIYRDIALLGRGREFVSEDRECDEDDFVPGYGMDIVAHGGRYYVRERFFSLQELKLLVDMVESSSNIPKETADALVGKLQAQTSSHESRYLQRHVGVRNQVKTLNEQFQLNADCIFEAMRSSRSIRFRYFQYNMNRRHELKHSGAIYEVSPFALVWVDQNYYMIAYSHKTSDIRNYRVDRMTDVRVTRNGRQGSELYHKTIGSGLPEYINKVFHMYSGHLTEVRIKFHRRLIDTVIDRFGEQITLIPEDSQHFSVKTELAVSPQFYGWLAGFGEDAELVFPLSEREKMKEHLKKSLARYE